MEKFCNGDEAAHTHTHKKRQMDFVWCTEIMSSCTHTHSHRLAHTLYWTVWGFLDMIPDITITIKVHFYSKRRPPVITSLLGQVLVSHSPAISPSRTTHGKGMQLQTRRWKQKHMLVVIRRNMSSFFSCNVGYIPADCTCRSSRCKNGTWTPLLAWRSGDCCVFSVF